MCRTLKREKIVHYSLYILKQCELDNYFFQNLKICWNLEIQEALSSQNRLSIQSINIIYVHRGRGGAVVWYDGGRYRSGSKNCLPEMRKKIVMNYPSTQL